MKIITLRNDFGVSDISDEEDVESIIGKIDIELNSHIELDLSGCLIDYPSTSKLIDTIMDQLSPMYGEKKLTILTDYSLPMPTVVNWLFLGSRRLNLGLNKGLPYQELIQIIEAALSQYSMIIQISIVDDRGNLKDELIIPKG